MKAALAILITLAGAVLLLAAPTPKATGGVEYSQPGYFLVFNAFEATSTAPAKGQVTNQTPTGDFSYQAQVSCAKVDGSDAWFSAIITSSTPPGVGPSVFIKVHDGGEPSTNDLVSGQFMDNAAAIAACEAKATPTGGPWPVLSGNLQVH